MTVALVSSVYGGYDRVAPPVPQGCDMVLVTDQPGDHGTWRTVIEPRGVHPRLAAKVAKTQPHLYADADVYVWVDASIHVVAPDFAEWCAGQLNGGHLAQIPHPERTRISDEANVSARMIKYHGLPVVEQAAHYIAGGYPDGWGLWETGVVVYSKAFLETGFGAAWLAEQVRWTYQDQLSEAPTLHRFGVKPVDLEGPMRRNPRFTLRSHLRED